MKKIKIENLSFGYKKNQYILKNLSFEVKSNKNSGGYVSAIMGSSGSGKSTLLKLILSTEKNYSGSIITEPINPILSYVPQEAVLFEHMTPIQNSRYFEYIKNYQNRFNNELFKEIEEILELNIVLKNSNSVLNLSGGERQRISLLRALSIKPDILILDEPCNGLDSEVKKHFLQKLREIVYKYNLLVLYVTHHKIEAQLIADEIIYLSKDKNLNYVSKIYQKNIIDFIEEPPYLDAALSFSFPELNTIYCFLDDNNLIRPIKKFEQNEKEINTFFLSFNIQDIELSNTDGFSGHLISSSPTYSIIKLKDFENTLIIKSNLLNKIDLNSNIFINLNGKALMYHTNGILEKKVYLKNNKIIIN